MGKLGEFPGVLFVITIVMFFLFFMIGRDHERTYYNNLKQQCAKDNNVYECVIVAVPKEGE